MTVLTVSQLNIYLKSVFDELPPLQNIYISGEISNFKHYYQSGHFYFTLKDANSQLKCVMFSSDNYKLKFKPENGMNVLCFGQVGVYERDGVYQLYVRDMQPRGVGELAIAFEQLKAQLEREGLFDEIYKKPIPRYPSRIGVATSNVGAAVEDIKNVLSRRYPLCEIIIVPTMVQGEAAPNDIVKALALLDSLDLDTIILGRGGGSIEDLWAFNTEPVARAVFNCKTPVISAVGHETDYTICDFVADLRAPTPSAAAELAVPDIRNEVDRVNNTIGSIEYLINRKLELEENRLFDIMNNSALSDMTAVITGLEQNLNNYVDTISTKTNNIIQSKFNDLSKSASTLNALSPLAVLGRGYSITSSSDGIVSSVNQIRFGDEISIRVSDGYIDANVKEVRNNE